MLAVWWPTTAGFALGSVLLGLPFTAISLFAMQEARRLVPHNAAAYMGVLTAAYGLGQIAGPALVGAILQNQPDVSAGFAWALGAAAAALFLGVLLYVWLLLSGQTRTTPS
jgi:MFS family permease